MYYSFRYVLIAVYTAIMFAGLQLLLNAQPLTRSRIRFGVIDKRQGLPNDIVFAIAQDRQGFLWFATMDGLARWDGYAMRVWRHNPEDSTGLASSDIRWVMEDSEGMIWVCTQAAGVHRFNPRTETFDHFYHKKGDPATIDGDEATAIFEDKQRQFWILAGGTLHLFDRRTRKVLQKYRSREAAANPTKQSFTPLGTPLQNTLENAIHTAHLTENGEIWVAGKLLPMREERAAVQQWGSLNTETGKITPLFDNTVINNTTNFGYPHKLNDTTLLICSIDAGMFVYNTRTHAIIHQHLPNPANPRAPQTRDMRSIFRDRLGRLWINSIGGGLIQFHPKTDDFTNYQHDPNNPASLPFSSSLYVFEDRQGIIWIGTPAGAAFYDANAEKFTPYTAGFPDADTGFLHAGKPLRTSTRLIFSLKPTRADSNALWICATAEGSLMRFNTKTEAFTRFWNTTAHPHMLPCNNVYTSFERPDGLLWLGFRHGGFVLFDPKQRRCLQRYLTGQAIFPVLEDTISHRGKRYLWAGNLGSGLHRFDIATKEIKNYAHDAANPHSFIGRAVFWANFDNQKRLWFGSMNGLSLYRPATDDFENFTHEKANPRSLSCNYVECVVEDSRGRVWIGTEDGLNLFNEQTRNFTSFGVKDGLPSAVVLGIVEDAHGNLWLSTNEGISRFNPEQRTFRNYNETDGLHGQTFNSAGFCKTADGRIWFGGVGGFTGFHPDSLRDNTLPPPVVLTEFRKFNKPVRLDTSIGFKRLLTLDYTENFITIGFAALNFTHPEKNKYKYKLEGFDRDWIDAGAKREASYTNLDGGDYVFRVIACNNDGVWCSPEEGASIQISVTPPFWKTRWFAVLAVLGIIGSTAGSIVVVYQRRITRQHLAFELESVQRQAEHERQLDLERVKIQTQAHERERIFRDIHDGLGANIVEIAAMSEQLQSELANTTNNAEQQRWAAAISANVRNLRGSLRETVWLLNMENDTLEALTAYLRQEVRRISEAASIRVHADISEECKAQTNIKPDVRRNVVMAVREACGNVVKHAEASEIWFILSISNGRLSVSIRDNGKGFNPAEEKRFSNGLKTMQKRMDACNGSVNVDSAPGAGTTVLFSLQI